MTLLYNQSGSYLGYNPNSMVTKEYTSSQNTVFCGSAFLKEYLYNITESDIYNIFPDLSVELLQEIHNLEFFFRNEGDMVGAGEALVIVTGNPLAIEIVHNAIVANIGGQSAISTTARSIVRCVRGLDETTVAQPNLFPHLQLSQNKRSKDACAYLGLRRGEGGNAEDDYAAWKGGFVAAANINTEINRDKYRYVKTTMPVVGTIAHFWIMAQTALHNHAIATNQLNSLLDCLNITTDQYSEAKNNVLLDLNDYVAFRAYIRAVQHVETKINANTGKSVKKSIVLLVDTTDTIKGVHAAVHAAKDSGRIIDGIRLDTSPEKHILEAASILELADLKHVKIYCTDGIDLSVAKQIHDKCVNVTNPIVYGIGSAVANTPSLKLKTKILDRNTMVGAEKFCLANEDLSVETTVNDKRIPADFYALSQADFLHCLNELLKEKGIDGFTHGGSTLNFRYRKDTPNYLIMAGIDQVKRAIYDFVYTDDFIKMMKDLGLSYTDEEYANIRGKKLDLELAYVPDGSIFGPYQAGVQITGPLDQVLFVESFVLSTIGNMSAVSSAAKELIQSMRFSNDEISSMNTELQAILCKMYNISSISEYNDKYAPYFVYMPENEKRLSTNRCNAAYIGGFKATTIMARQHGLDIPFVQQSVSYSEYCSMDSVAKSQQHSVAINRADYPDGIEISILDTLKNQGKTIQIIGGFDNVAANLDLRNKLFTAGININKVQFLVGEPLSSKKNEKGLVYKTDFIKVHSATGENKVVYAIKAAGNIKPGIKNSIPAMQQRLALLTHAGIPLATISFDAALINAQEDLLSSLISNPQLYYQNKAQSDQVIALGMYNFGKKIPDSFEIITSLATKDISTSKTMLSAQHLAEKHYKLGLHRLPMLMENRMFANLQAQLDACDNKRQKSVLVA